MAALEDAGIEEDWSSLEWPELDRWPDLPRKPRRTPPFEGSGVVCGRKFCPTCGRWRPISDYLRVADAPDGSPRVQSRCRVCTQRKERMKLAQRPYRAELSCDEAIYAGPFFRWFDAWMDRNRYRWFGDNNCYATPMTTEKTIMETIGSSARTLYRARHEGRISRAIVDRILVLLDADVQLWELEA